MNENQITNSLIARLLWLNEAVDAYTAFFYLAGPIGLFKDLSNGTIARAVEYEKTYKPNLQTTIISRFVRQGYDRLLDRGDESHGKDHMKVRISNRRVRLNTTR